MSEQELDFSGLFSAMADFVQASTDLQIAILEAPQVDEEAIWVSNFMRDHKRCGLERWHLNQKVSLLRGTYTIIGLRDNVHSPVVLRNGSTTIFKSAGSIYCALTM